MTEQQTSLRTVIHQTTCNIALFGVPRSGTSWLGQLFNSHPDVFFSYQPLFSYSHKGKLSEHSSQQEIESFFQSIREKRDAFADMNSDFHKNYPVFYKKESPGYTVFKETRYLHIVENLLLKSEDLKVIGIIRNPYDTLTSWINVSREFSSDWDISREWRSAPSKNQNKPEEFYGYDKWKEIYKLFTGFQYRFPAQFRLVFYRDLVQNPVSVVQEIFGFCGLELHEQVLSFIRESRTRHDDDPYSVYRAHAGAKDMGRTLPREVVHEIEEDLSKENITQF
jgi:hypothetical protein